jgi:uncharacterized protein (DUF952 family)
MTAYVFKIMTASEWMGTQEEGVFTGSPVDREDGFIHFSSVSQVKETARRHFAGQDGLMLIWVDEASIADKLKWEPSRSGSLFPHLYGALPLSAVMRCDSLLRNPAGELTFPPDLPIGG